MNMIKCNNFWTNLRMYFTWFFTPREFDTTLINTLVSCSIKDAVGNDFIILFGDPVKYMDKIYIDVLLDYKKKEVAFNIIIRPGNDIEVFFKQHPGPNLTFILPKFRKNFILKLIEIL